MHDCHTNVRDCETLVLSGMCDCEAIEQPWTAAARWPTAAAAEDWQAVPRLHTAQVMNPVARAGW